ncbi:MAG: hypothetical protein VW551_00320 [Euryarchaeota archaeon]|jgi:hypothetical protein
MNSGVLVFAYNNEKVNYIEQAIYLASRISKYLNLPTSIVTDTNSKFDESHFDKVIRTDPVKYTLKTYNNGTSKNHSLSFKNDKRVYAYDLSPYDNTLLMDTDYIIADSVLSNCFNSCYDFMIYKDAVDLAGHRDYSEFDKISETGIDFYWATCVYFTRTEKNKKFFSLLQHIQENYQHYRQVYQIQTPVYRNDHAFSIAIHIMNGFEKNNFAKKMPGTMFYTTDRDIIYSIKDDEFKFLLEKEKVLHEYTPATISGNSVHVMNKFSLAEVING